MIQVRDGVMPPSKMFSVPRDESTRRRLKDEGLRSDGFGRKLAVSVDGVPSVATGAVLAPARQNAIM